MAIDQRLVERRKIVAEDRARRNVSRLLKAAVALAMIAGLVWLALSPYLSVSEVRVAGVVTSDVHRTLADQGLIAGTPMITIRSAGVEAALERDPWVADANVTLKWPDTVVVQIVERVPTAWVETKGGWARRAVDGVALPSPERPDGLMAWIQMPGIAEETAMESIEILGALEFVNALPAELSQETLVRFESGELWAQVSGYQVRLGRPVEMREKALSLIALLQTTPGLDQILVLVAPTHPALAPARSPVGEPAGPEDLGSGEGTEPGADPEDAGPVDS